MTPGGGSEEANTPEEIQQRPSEIEERPNEIEQSSSEIEQDPSQNQQIEDKSTSISNDILDSESEDNFSDITPEDLDLIEVKTYDFSRKRDGEPEETKIPAKKSKTSQNWKFRVADE